VEPTDAALQLEPFQWTMVFGPPTAQMFDAEVPQIP
jgi:hypothetical protein